MAENAYGPWGDMGGEDEGENENLRVAVNRYLAGGDELHTMGDLDYGGWFQNAEMIHILMVIPDGINSEEQIVVETINDRLYVRIFQDNTWTTMFVGVLADEVFPQETDFDLEPEAFIRIHLVKRNFNWWVTPFLEEIFPVEEEENEPAI